MSDVAEVLSAIEHGAGLTMPEAAQTLAMMDHSNIAGTETH